MVAVQNEKKGFHYEFGGPLGAVGIVVGLPLVVLFLASARYGLSLMLLLPLISTEVLMVVVAASRLLLLM